MRSRQRGSGQALVELILVLPLFLVLLLGLLDFGRIIWAQNAIRLNAEHAARYASVSTDSGFTQAVLDSNIRDQAQRISPAVSYDPLSAITGLGGDPSSFYPNECNCAVVEIEVDVPLVTPIVSQIVGGVFPVRAKAEELIHE